MCTSTFEGRSQVAIDAARDVAAKVPHHHAGAVAWNSDFPVTPLLAYVRFGQWRKILTEPAPPTNQPYANGIWHYARAMAYVAGTRLDRAESELAALAKVMEHEAFTTTLKDMPLLTNLRVASRMVEAELAARRGDTAEATVSPKPPWPSRTACRAASHRSGTTRRARSSGRSC